MVNVLADLALEAEAAAAASFRIVRAFDEGDRTFGRMALAVMKYWICKRGARVRGRGARVPGRQRLHRDPAGAGGPVLPRHPDRHGLGGLGQRDRARRAARDGARAREPRRVHGGVRVGARGGPAPRRASRRDARRARRPATRRAAVRRPRAGRGHGAGAAGVAAGPQRARRGRGCVLRRAPGRAPPRVRHAAARRGCRSDSWPARSRRSRDQLIAPMASAARFAISSGGTSSTCVATLHLWPKGSSN